MKRILVLIMLVLLLSCDSLSKAGPICNIATARQIVVQKSVIVQNGFAVVPFAVPVAVPVTTVNVPTVLYSFDAHRGYQQQPQAKTSEPKHTATTVLVVQKCAKCHSGEAPKGGLDLTNPSALTTKQRLSAVARVVSDDPDERMPKGATLSPGEIGRVLQELSRSE